MTYAVIKTVSKRTHYFNVVGKPETWHPIDVQVTLVSLHDDDVQAVIALGHLEESRSENIHFPLGENEDERFAGSATIEATSYQVVEMTPGAILSNLDDLAGSLASKE